MAPRVRILQVEGKFRERVYEIVRLVPFGQVTTYGFVSTLTGMPRQARQVGWALHTLPGDLVWGADSDGRHSRGPRQSDDIDAAGESRLGRVPWHRVINAKGQVSTHPDEAGTYRQIELLRAEGIEVSDDGALLGGLPAHEWVPDPNTVDRLELPAEVLFALDQHFAK